MKPVTVAAIVAVLVSSAALAGHSTYEVPVNKIHADFWKSKDARVGVALLETPPAQAYTRAYDTTMRMYRLQDWDKNMPKEIIEKANYDAAPGAAEYFAGLRQKFVRRLQSIGFTNVTEILEPLKEAKDYRAIKEKYPIDELVLIRVNAWGTERLEIDDPGDPTRPFVRPFLNVTASVIRIDDNRQLGTYHPESSISGDVVSGPDYADLASELKKALITESTRISSGFGAGVK